MSEPTPTDEASKAVERYFDHMRRGDTGVAELFHDDAVLLGLGRQTRGRDEIRRFYSESIRNASPQPRLAGPLLSDGRRVAAEILIGLADGTTSHVVDLFVVEQGRIRSLTYFVADVPSD